MNDNIRTTQKSTDLHTFRRHHILQIFIQLSGTLRHIIGIRHMHLTNLHTGRFCSDFMGRKKMLQLLNRPVKKRIYLLAVKRLIIQIPVQAEVHTGKSCVLQQRKSLFRIIVRHYIFCLYSDFHSFLFLVLFHFPFSVRLCFYFFSGPTFFFPGPAYFTRQSRIIQKNPGPFPYHPQPVSTQESWFVTYIHH